MIEKVTENLHHQKLVVDGFYTDADLRDVLETSFNRIFGPNIVEQFVFKMIALESKKTFYIEKINIELNLSEGDQKSFNYATE